ncbi:hypothetical protein Pcinc_034167 [Petrolisthes cinctipes]|uniref:Uncharacterized protein n=1 Tax=Petrolisthes cinctipes TaxID=88211 RepID=A0AAE1EQU8_PETCI|nr:hypothetical protein Pcinc_034167 [Petrolisthes cinctipes]
MGSLLCSAIVGNGVIGSSRGVRRARVSGQQGRQGHRDVSAAGRQGHRDVKAVGTGVALPPGGHLSCGKQMRLSVLMDEKEPFS